MVGQLHGCRPIQILRTECVDSLMDDCSRMQNVRGIDNRIGAYPSGLAFGTHPQLAGVVVLTRPQRRPHFGDNITRLGNYEHVAYIPFAVVSQSAEIRLGIASIERVHGSFNHRAMGHIGIARPGQREVSHRFAIIAHLRNDALDTTAPSRYLFEIAVERRRSIARQRLAIQGGVNTLPVRDRATRRNSIKPSTPIPCRIAREANNEHELMAIGVLDVGVVKIGDLFLISINVSRKQLGFLNLGRERLFLLGRLRHRNKARRQRHQPRRQDRG